MKCLTVCQPWAWAIIHGGKDIENRDWVTNYRGPILIHAGKSRKFLETENPADWPARYGVPFPDESRLVFGAIIGVANLIDCLPKRKAMGKWVEGSHCFLLRNPRPLVSPYPLSGMPGMFEVDLNAHPALIVPEMC